ncbi:RING-H2 finger protein ATL43 [Dioscorea cayenensis subsp. rotundata]|uniref:RING-type E3 ubiquitin transferase n=1 Tax=Dioscorea cayennensis subsp. rotundata TaxID=55577 RepID=A0AB40D4R2_DIOCR|nr:RING-H2 finger protein ATL43 [Dioscorea cayenensis subsp. rotundata]
MLFFFEKAQRLSKKQRERERENETKMGFCRNLGLCLSDLPHTTAPAPSPIAAQLSSNAALRPSIAIIVGVLTTTFSLTSLLLLYAKHCKNNPHSRGLDPSSSSTYAAPRRNSGLSPALIDALPAFRFSSLRCPSAKTSLLDCAVCLSSFLPSDPLRLLPRCRHAFHLDCLDTWLSAHSSCPLCRSPVSPDDLLLLPPIPHPESDKPPRRVSGRHSSAGEKSTSTPTPIEIDPRSRRSADSAAVSHRKDGLLLPLPAELAEKRFAHRIIVSNGDPTQERWSDLRPSDLLFLRSEMIITDSGRFSASRGRVSADGRIVNSLRSVSEITGVSRVMRSRREEEERTMRRWLGFAARRTARWLGRGGAGNEPNG